jgi:uncharacterized protein
VAARAQWAAAAFAALLLWPPVLFAAAAHPSFACTGGLNPTEAAICTDEGLAALDRSVATAYRNKFDGLPVESADALDQVVKSLVITQKAWLAYRNSCGADHTCIYKAYRTRQAALNAGDDAKDVPCNADNSCELIISHNVFRCAGLGDGAPKFCGAYTKP